MRWSVLGLMALLASSTAAWSANDSRFQRAAEISRAAKGTAMLVLIDGQAVFEEYGNGGAATRGTELASGTKSFSGVLALCAVEDGFLRLDEKVSDTIAEWRVDEARREITVREVLTLTSGIPGGESALVTGRVPSYAEAIQVKAVDAPGKRFSYGPVPFQVFGELMRRKLAARSDTVEAYFRRKILEPLGIEPARWRKDAAGQPHMPSGAALTARDWAKFGESIRLDAKGILPPGKVAECFKGTATNPGYGLTWWLPAAAPIGGAKGKREVGGGRLPKDTWMAAGAGGQRLVVIPSLKLVAVRQAPVRGGEGAFRDREWLRALVDGATAETRP